MMAKVSWKVAKADSGIVPLMASSPTPPKNAFERPPMKKLPSAKAQTVADDQPENGDQASDAEALHQHAQHVAGAHEAGIEQRQTGNRHEQHEGGGNSRSRPCRPCPAPPPRRERPQAAPKCRLPVSRGSVPCPKSLDSVPLSPLVRVRRPPALAKRGTLPHCVQRRHRRGSCRAGPESSNGLAGAPKARHRPGARLLSPIEGSRAFRPKAIEPRGDL